jgi:hypothetical protein
MPIVFEAPQPLDPSISAGYGAAEMQTQQYPQIVAAASAAAQHQLGLARLGEGGGGGDGALAQNMALRYGQANQEAAQNAGLTQQAQGADQQAAAQASGAQAKVGIYQAMQDIDFSQANKLQLQELQNDQAAIMQQITSGQLTPDEGNAMLQQVQMPLGALKKIQTAAQIKAQQQQTQQQQQQFQQQAHFQAMGTSMQIEDAAMAAKHGARFTFKDDEGNSFYVDPATKKVSQIKSEKDNSAAQAQAQQKADQDRAAKAEAQDMTHYQAAATKAEAAVEKWASALDPSDPDKKRLKYPKMSDDTVRDNGLTTRESERNAELRRILGHDVGKGGEPLEFQEYHQAKQAQRGLGPKQPTNGQAPTGEPSAAATSGQPGTPQLDVKKAEEAQPRFAGGPPKTQEQTRTVAQLFQAKQIALQSRLPEDAKRMFLSQADTAVHLLSHWGSPDVMRVKDPAGFAHYEAIQQSILQMVRTQEPKPTPPQPPAAPRVQPSLGYNPTVGPKF